MANEEKMLCQQYKDYGIEELRNKKLGQSMDTWNNEMVVTPFFPVMADPIPKGLLAEMKKWAKNEDT